MFVFGNVGMPELILILAIALLVFGPKKLPEVGRSIGKALREFKKATEEVTGRLEKDVEVSEFKGVHQEIRAGLNSLRDGVRGIFDAAGGTGARDENKEKTDVPTQSAPGNRAGLKTAADSGPDKNVQDEAGKTDKAATAPPTSEQKNIG